MITTKMEGTGAEIKAFAHNPFITREDLMEIYGHVRSLEFVISRIHALSGLSRHEEAAATAYSCDIYVDSLKRELQALLAYAK